MERRNVGLAFARDYLDKQSRHFRKKWENNYNGFRKDFHLGRSSISKALTLLKHKNVVVTDTLSKPVEPGDDTLFITPAYFKKAKSKVSGLLKADIAQDIWGRKKYYPIINEDVYPRIINKAMSYWKQAKRFAEGNIILKKDQNRYVVEK
jgi:hypothetical protein